MNLMKFLFPNLGMRLRPAFYEDGVSPRGHYDGLSVGKTRRGAIHNHRPTFRARRISQFTPAQFRHQHLGRTSARHARKEEGK